MKKTTLLLSIILTLSLFSCKEDDSRSCTICRGPLTLDFELCEESDGNASVNGENTGTPYDVYLNDLKADGTICGGT